MAEQERAFLRFILQTTVRQASLLLQHATPLQLAAIGEVCFNLMHGELNTELIQELKPYRNIIRTLADKQSSISQRRTLASRKSSAIQNILRLCQDILP